VAPGCIKAGRLVCWPTNKQSQAFVIPCFRKGLRMLAVSTADRWESERIVLAADYPQAAR